MAVKWGTVVTALVPVHSFAPMSPCVHARKACSATGYPW